MPFSTTRSQYICYEKDPLTSTTPPPTDHKPSNSLPMKKILKLVHDVWIGVSLIWSAFPRQSSSFELLWYSLTCIVNGENSKQGIYFFRSSFESLPTLIQPTRHDEGLSIKLSVFMKLKAPPPSSHHRSRVHPISTEWQNHRQNKFEQRQSSYALDR